MASSGRFKGVTLEAIEHRDVVACDVCGDDYFRVYGNLWEGEAPALPHSPEDLVGVYSVDLHSSDHERRALLALGIMDWNKATEQWERASVTIEIWIADAELQLAFRERDLSPFADGRLGRVLDRAEAAAHPYRRWLLRLAEEVATQDQRVKAHLGP